MAQSQHPKSLHSAPLTQRQKHLNVIYFIDSSKTRSFKVSLKWTYLTAGFMAFLVLWLLVSGFVLMAVANQNAKSHTRIKNLLATIFQYQSRYDQVYETAYESTPGVAKPNPVAANKPKTETTSAKPSQPAALPEDREDVETATSEQPVAGAPSEAGTAENVPFPIEVIDIADQGFDSYVQVKFAIRNSDSTRKISGYVWGIATYENVKGEKSYVGAPVGIRADADGMAPTGKSGDRFGIKFFKAKTFIFSFPLMEGRFTNIKVFIADENGDIQFTKELKTNYLKPAIVKKVEPARSSSAALPTTPTPTPDEAADQDASETAPPSGDPASEATPTSTDNVPEEESFE